MMCYLSLQPRKQKQPTKTPMKQLKFKNPKVQAFADRINEPLTITVLIVAIVVLWWLERRM